MLGGNSTTSVGSSPDTDIISPVAKFEISNTALASRYVTPEGVVVVSGNCNVPVSASSGAGTASRPQLPVTQATIKTPHNDQPAVILRIVGSFSKRQLRHLDSDC